MSNRVISQLKKRIRVICSIATFCITTITFSQNNAVVTTAFDCPDSMSFAGESIQLKRCDLRERFDKEIMNIAYRQAYTLTGLKNANRYFPIIEPILKENDVPDDFKYLALIESNLDIKALSNAKAAGFWQLMPATAQELGLVVNDEVDERYDIAKSTEAACKYLKKSYVRFNDWMLVAASYNGGMGRIRSQSNKQMVDNFFDMWLNSETSRYVFRLLAIKQFMSDPQKYGFRVKKSQFYQNIRYDEETVDSRVPDWAVYAQAHGTTYYQLRCNNRWIQSPKLENREGNTYTVLIPKAEDLNFDINKIKIHQNSWVAQ